MPVSWEGLSNAANWLANFVQGGRDVSDWRQRRDLTQHELDQLNALRGAGVYDALAQEQLKGSQAATAGHEGHLEPYDPNKDLTGMPVAKLRTYAEGPTTAMGVEREKAYTGAYGTQMAAATVEAALQAIADILTSNDTLKSSQIVNYISWKYPGYYNMTDEERIKILETDPFIKENSDPKVWAKIFSGASETDTPMAGTINFLLEKVENVPQHIWEGAARRGGFTSLLAKP